MDAPEGKHLRKHWLMRVLLSKAFIIAVALMITYTLAGFFLAPYLINPSNSGCRMANRSPKRDGRERETTLIPLQRETFEPANGYER